MVRFISLPSIMSFLSSYRILKGSVNILSRTEESVKGAEDPRSPPCTSFLSSYRILEGSVNILSRTEESVKGAEDPRSPPCTVYLYTRPVVSAEGKGTAGAKHWALYFDWGYYNATYEANEYNGLLTPFRREGKPVAPNNLRFEIKVVKENLRVTPHAVEKEAKGNKYTGKIYDLLLANCQIWAKELARLLGFKLPSGQVEQVVDIGLTSFVLLGEVTLGQPFLSKLRRINSDCDLSDINFDE